MQDKRDANSLSTNGNIFVLDDSSVDSHASVQAIPDQTEQQNNLRNILVVEDDASLANLEAEVLTAHGYTVAIANSGELAITAFHETLPDLVVLDLELPDAALTGIDVLQALRAFATIPVLFTTSSEAEVRRLIRIRGESRLTLDYLPKPYPIEALLKRIKRMLMIVPQ